MIIKGKFFSNRKLSSKNFRKFFLSSIFIVLLLSLFSAVTHADLSNQSCLTDYECLNLSSSYNYYENTSEGNFSYEVRIYDGFKCVMKYENGSMMYPGKCDWNHFIEKINKTKKIRIFPLSSASWPEDANKEWDEYLKEKENDSGHLPVPSIEDYKPPEVNIEGTIPDINITPVAKPNRTGFFQENLSNKTSNNKNFSNHSNYSKNNSVLKETINSHTHKRSLPAHNNVLFDFSRVIIKIISRLFKF